MMRHIDPKNHVTLEELRFWFINSDMPAEAFERRVEELLRAQAR